MQRSDNVELDIVEEHRLYLCRKLASMQRLLHESRVARLSYEHVRAYFHILMMSFHIEVVLALDLLKVRSLSTYETLS